MSNLVESLQMCLWFDVNIISRRNLLSAIISSFLVSFILLENKSDDSSQISFHVFVCVFSSSVLGGSSSELQQQPRKKKLLTSVTIFVESSAPSHLLW